MTRFVEAFGRLPKQRESLDDCDIGAWLERQRADKQLRDFPARYQKLEELGAFKTVWDANFELLQKFIEVNGRLPKNNEQFEVVKLGSWLSRQKKSKSLTKYPDRIKKLEKVGVQLISEGKQTE